MRLSVIIPAYNEEDRIDRTLRAVDDYLSRQNYSYEIIVVNDGSTDRTLAVARGLEPFVKCLRVIDNAANRGKGAVVGQGMLEAAGEIRLFMDADNSTSIEQVEKMFAEFSSQGGSPPEADAPQEHASGGEKGAEVVIGSRRAPGAVIAKRQNFLRENMGVVFNWIVRLLAGLPYQDTQAGFKAFSARAAKEIFSRQTITRFAFDVEVLVIARQLGLAIKEVPITWVNSPKTHVTIKNMVQMLVEVFKVRLNLKSGKYGARRWQTP